MNRVVEPELLDELPADDSRAIRSRGDLRRLNWLMRHADILCAQAVSKLPRPPKRLADIGAGDGLLMLDLARRLHRRWPGVRVTLVDRQPAVTVATQAQFAAFGWPVEIVTADIFNWLDSAARYDAIFANLFLHHFSNARLAELLQLIAARTDFFLAAETRRTFPSFAVCRLLWLLGCNEITRHDAGISMRAGFAGRELSALWPPAGWRREERGAILFTHLFAAQRPAG